MNRRQTITQALHDLGTNQDEVFQSLKDAGFIGERSSLDWCPVALYLQFKVNLDIRVNLDMGAVVRSDGKEGQVTLPNAVLQFLTDFDAGMYPELENSNSEF